MNLYLIYQNENIDYDIYDSAVVVAESVTDARTIHPNPRGDYFLEGDWTSPKNVHVKLLGKAAPEICRGAVCGSFNAG